MYLDDIYNIIKSSNNYNLTLKMLTDVPKGIDLGIKIYFRNFLWEKEKKNLTAFYIFY